MPAHDLARAVLPHATSKLRTEADLEAIQTLGFRGEALSSIASVSRLSLFSRPRASVEGAVLELEGGAIKKREVCGVPAGTRVEVRDLFFNVPARRKFLKAKTTELSHISEAVLRLALAHDHVAFVLRHEQRLLLDAPAHQGTSPEARYRKLLGGRFWGDNFFPVHFEEDQLCIMGFVTSPETPERHTRALYCFVNQRFVRDKTIQHAVNSAFRPFLAEGEFPRGVVFLSIPGDEVDVNVHPQKTEVRFLDPNRGAPFGRSCCSGCPARHNAEGTSTAQRESAGAVVLVSTDV